MLPGCGTETAGGIDEDALSAALEKRDARLASLDESVAGLLTTVEAQQATITDQEATLAQNALAIAALEAAVGEGGTIAVRLDALEATDATILAATDSNTAAITRLRADLTDLDTSVVSLSSEIAALGGDVLDAVSRVTALEGDVTTLEGDIAALEAVVDAAAAAEAVWHDEGTGTGNCARANVSTTSARPLYVFATMEADFSAAGGCSSPPCTSGSPVSTTTSGTVTINAEDSTGAWTDSVSATESMSVYFVPAVVSGYYTGTQYSAYLSLGHTWTVPVQAVLEIPAAGDYIVDLDVTTFSGDCRLVVLQP